MNVISLDVIVLDKIFATGKWDFSSLSDTDINNCLKLSENAAAGTKPSLRKELRNETTLSFTLSKKKINLIFQLIIYRKGSGYFQFVNYHFFQECHSILHT